MSPARYAAVVVLAPAAAALAARVALAHAPPGVAAGLAQPLPVVTEWHLFGGLLFAALAIAVAAAGWAYLRLLAMLRAGAEVPVGLIAGACVLAIACAWSAPALFSSDVYAYAAYGEMARAGMDPYAHAPLPAGNPVFAAAIWQWGNPPPVCVYGPAFVALATALVAATASLGVLAQLDALRIAASLALLACGAGAYLAYPGSRAARALAAATIVLNPVAIWCAVEGHNDAAALAIVLAGYALIRRGAPGIGAATAALAGALKAPGLAAAFPLLLHSGRARAGAIAGIAIAAVLAIPVARALATGVAPGGHYAPQASLQAIFGALPPPLGVVVAIGACALLARTGAVRLRRGDSAGWVFLALAAWVLVPNPYPWYGIWLLAAAALAPGTRVAAVALLVSLTSLLRYVPDAVATPGAPAAVLLGAAAVLPFAALL